MSAPHLLIPRFDIEFGESRPRYDFSRDIVTFSGSETTGMPVTCAISREAIEDHFHGDGLDQAGRVEVVRKNRALIEAMARQKYRDWPIEEPNFCLIKTMDVERLRRERQR